MGISMEKSVHENLVEISAEKLFGQRGPIEVHPRQRTHVRDFSAWHIFHCQDACRAIIRNRRWQYNQSVVLQLFAKCGEVLGLLAIIEFSQQALAELLQQFCKFVALSKFSVLIKELRYFLQRLQVIDQRFTNVGALHFDRDGTTVAQACDVDLTERSRRNRLGFKLRECLCHTHAQILGNNLLDVTKAEWLNFVLQPGKCVEIGSRQQFHSRRK